MQNFVSSGMPRPGGQPNEGEGIRSTRSLREDLWAEFNNHFRNKDRPVVKVNHHDFLDGNFLTKLKE